MIWLRFMGILLKMIDPKVHKKMKIFIDKYFGLIYHI